MRILPAQSVVSWRGEVSRAGRPLASFNRSTVAGMLLTRDDLARRRPDYVPSLSARGRARKTVLDLCDGARALREVERELFERHRDLSPRSRRRDLHDATRIDDRCSALAADVSCSA
jgi:hypothetical protein